jgi:hypothetical protein
MNNTSTQKKIRVLILSALIPVQKSGAGCLTMYRHFLQKNDFEIAVAASREFDNGKIPFFEIKSYNLIERLKKTRFTRLIRNIEYFLNWMYAPIKLVEFCKDFKPDIIFSVIDDWHMGIAWNLSRKARIPLAIDFQDLFALSTFIDKYSKPYSLTVSFLINRYRFLNRSAEVVFHVGPGMREWFGIEKRGSLLYPMANGESINKPENTNRPEGAKYILAYTGNCRGAYGKMVCKFAKEALNNSSIDFRIFSLGNDFSESDYQFLVDKGIYRGYLPFEKLNLELEKADAFLLVMSFEKEDKVFVNTSFNTKWVDYVAYSKPIIVWAPNYSSAAQFAITEGVAALVEENNPRTVLEKAMMVLNNPEYKFKLAEKAHKASTGLLSPSKLQKVLNEELSIAIKNNNRE